MPRRLDTYEYTLTTEMLATVKLRASTPEEARERARQLATQRFRAATRGSKHLRHGDVYIQIADDCDPHGPESL